MEHTVVALSKDTADKFSPLKQACSNREDCSQVKFGITTEDEVEGNICQTDIEVRVASGESENEVHEECIDVSDRNEGNESNQNFDNQSNGEIMSEESDKLYLQTDDNVEFEVLHVQVAGTCSSKKSKRKNPPRRKVVRHYCYECGSNFDNENLLKEHMETCIVPSDSESEILVKVEPESDEDFTASPTKKPKTENENIEKKYECDICQSKFKQMNYLRHHQIKVHGWNLYPCGFCELSFLTVRDCANHVKMHGEEKPYCCDVCGRRYVLRESLNRHYKVHDVNKAYICDICGKAFAEKISLTRHQHIHTGMNKLYIVYRNENNFQIMRYKILQMYIIYNI